MKSWIMIAGPYSSSHASPARRAENLKSMNEAALTVFRKGHMPLIGVNMALPMIEAGGPDSFDEIMMPVSLELAERCDAILRVGGKSKGADAELASFKSRGLPVYFDPSEIPEVHL